MRSGLDADGLAQTRGHHACQFRLLIKLSVGARDIRAGEVRFDAIGAAFHGPFRAAREVASQVIHGPVCLGRSDDGDGEYLVFRQRAASGLDVGTPHLGRF